MSEPFVSLISRLERRYAIRTALTGAFSQNYVKGLACEGWLDTRSLAGGRWGAPIAADEKQQNK
jgi:hypothetical protein